MKNPTYKQQAGAALVIALILLVALSLMAISSMNTASLDLIMSGNEQYRSHAFAAAETGIEKALSEAPDDSSSDYGSGGTLPATAVSLGTGHDTYAYTITRPNSGAVETPPSGYSEGAGQFGTVYFRITSSGTSERGTKAANVQEYYEVVKSGDSASCITSLTTCALD